MSLEAARPARPIRRLWRGLLLATGSLLIVLLVLLGWLLGSQSGLRCLLAGVERATHGDLQVTEAHGRLWDDLQLHNARYRDKDGTEVRVADLQLAWRPLELLRGRVRVTRLIIRSVEVQLPPDTPDEPEPPDQRPLSLAPPLDLHFALDQLDAERFTLRQAKSTLFSFNHLSLVGAWDSQQLRISRLTLAAAEGELAMHGQISADDRYRGQAMARFHWQLGGQRLDGHLNVQSNAIQAQAELALASPAPARFHFELQRQGALPWQAKLEVPRFALAKLSVADTPLREAALNLDAQGDQSHAKVTAQLSLDRYRLRLQPLALHFDRDSGKLDIERLELSSPEFSGQVRLRGQVQLHAQPIAGTLSLDWQQVRLPADLIGRLLESHGQLQAQGNAEHFSAKGAFAIGPPDQLSQIDLALQANPKRIQLKQLALKQRQGELSLKGQVQLQPALSWQLDLLSHHIDLGPLLPEWPSQLDLALASRGQLIADTPELNLDIKNLRGQLRQHPLVGQGQLKLSRNQLSGHLNLRSGSSHLRLQGQPGKNSNHAMLDLDIERLSDWLPGSQGRISAQAQVTGGYPALGVDGHIQAHRLSWNALRLGQLDVQTKVADISHPAGQGMLDAQALSISGVNFKRIQLAIRGNQIKHTLKLAVQSNPLSAELVLEGSYRQPQWQGQLSRLDAHWPHIPAISLLHPATLGYNRGQARLEAFCLAAHPAQLCLDASQARNGDLSASYRLQNLPLSLMLAAAGGDEPLPIHAEGRLQGQGAIQRNARGGLRGQVHINSAQGVIRYAQQPDHPLLAYQGLALDARLDAAQQAWRLHAALSDQGYLDSQVTLSPGSQTMHGQLAFQLGSLAFISLLSPQLANVKGHVSGQFTLSGTPSIPQLRGQARLVDFAAEVPVAGLRLTQGQLVLTAADTQHLNLNAGLHSGDGKLALQGNIALGAGETSQLNLRGERFTAVDLPVAKVAIRPDLTLNYGLDGLSAQGQLTLDLADVNLDKLPGGSHSGLAASSDIVVVGEKPAPKLNPSLPISAQIAVDLGQATHLHGQGLDGKLGGMLKIHQQPDQAPLGQGEIAVTGNYQAYGQNLNIERGQLLFADNRLDNPGLNLRAYRKINPNLAVDNGQRVGVDITGTAQSPSIAIYSEPAMNQSEALSYLVTGKPMDQLSGRQGDIVSHAAQALGSAAGDYLAKNIGSQLGVDDIAVSGNSAFTVGKYLSPKLYLSYGIGLFDPGQIITLRYLISPRWNFEAQNANQYNRASLNFHWEK